MLTCPTPFQGELERGYLGRVMRLNGKQNPKETLDHAATWLGFTDNTRKDIPSVELLSKVAGVDLRHFVCQHTTLPLRRSITGYSSDLAHGDESSRSMLIHSGMRMARTGAYFCKQCMTEDQDIHGMCYWHREHQIPGVFWCPSHKTPLSYVDKETSFLSSPAGFLSSAIAINNKQIATFKANEAIQRFLEISFELLNRDKPLHNKPVAEALKLRALKKQLRNWGGTQKDPLLSDIVLDSFNSNWLNMTLPAMLKKERGKVIHQLDGLFYGKKDANSATAYILAASVLYETADEALNLLTSSKIKSLPRSSHDPKHRTPLGDDKLRNSYLQHGGNHSAVAKDMQRKKLSVTSRLNSLGLPNLAYRNRNTFAFISAFLIEGRKLQDSKAISGITDHAMEHVLRTISSPFTQIIKEIKKAAPKNKEKSRRIRPLTPQQVSRPE